MTQHQAIADRLASLTDQQLSDVMCGLMSDFRPEADAVFDACMRVAQERMTSADFLALCSQMEAAA
ncbi:MAG: hypothetical protein EBR82_68060 [Caulobacteraceae bacterium]|nr:hypothetical protein [Caulobacteraceae bacterium]